MKKQVLIALGLAVGTAAAIAQTGNGAPSGSHYNLNIIAKEQCPPISDGPATATSSLFF